jgi:hypothetical protein
MTCKSNTRGCLGAYTAEACAACEITEGDKCAMTGKTLRCTGPLNLNACSFCKALTPTEGDKEKWFEGIKEHRQKFKGWRATLSLPAKLDKIYIESSKLSPAQIDQKVRELSLDGLSFDWCPWVNVGNLYMTVTTGNANGWRLLIGDLFHPIQRRKFSVFTGRHGNWQGTITQETSDLFADGVADPSHLTQDIIQKVLAESAHAAKPQKERPVIRMWDVGTTAGTTMTKTQQLAAERLREGDIVIFAWCWSFLSVYKATAGSERAEYPLYKTDQAYNRPIEKIVFDRYGWVKTLSLDNYSIAKLGPDFTDWQKKVGEQRLGLEKIMPLVLGGVKPDQDGIYKDKHVSALEEKLEEVRRTHHH